MARYRSGGVGSTVETTEVTDLSITAAKLAADAVTTAKILDGAVTLAKTTGVNPSTDQLEYPDDTTEGNYSNPSAAAASSNIGLNTNNGYNANTTAGWSGKVWATKFTGLTVGNKITSVAINITILIAGSIRVKIYQDDGAGGSPSTLLAESAAVAQAAGDNLISLTTEATIPASGNVWAAFEINSNSTLSYTAAGPANSRKGITHAFGAGPSPFGTPDTDDASPPYIRIYSTGSAAECIDGSTTTRWQSSSEVNPSIDLTISGAADQEPSEILIYFHANTTVTSLGIYESPDDTTYTLIKTVNISAVTPGENKFIRLQRPTEQMRYIRLTGLDAGAAVLAINKVKYVSRTESQWNRRHGHTSLATETLT